MEIQSIDILLRLIIAHLLADFIFQTDEINNGKRKGIFTGAFGIHLLIVGVTAYVLLADWSNWWLPLIVMVLHGGIDSLKIKLSGETETLSLYLADQFFHLLSLVAVWSIAYSVAFLSILEPLGDISNNASLIVIIAFLIVTLPLGYLIGMVTQKWRSNLKDPDESLRKAGQTIGVIERTLILIFVLVQQWEAIGFLLAAKSVFRFGDLNSEKERKNTEYILIGTLLSFALSIVLGIFTLYLLERV